MPDKGDMSSAISTPTDFFWKPENNRVSPSEMPSKEIRCDLPLGLSPWEMICAARELGARVALGTFRTGVHEIQTDEGIWTRQGPNRREHSSWTFEAWE